MKSYSVRGTVGYVGYLPGKVFVRDGKISGELSERRADIGTWYAPPHVELANMHLPAASKVMIGFFRQHGALNVNSSYRDGWVSKPGIPPSEMVNIRYPKPVNQDFVMTIQELAEAQTVLRLAWHGDRTMLLELEQSIKRGEFLVASPISDEQDVLTTRDLWGFICYVFLLDYRDGKAKICAFRDCSTPYFVKVRTDQTYCSHRCAVKDNNLRRAQPSKSKSSRRRTQ
jgi:hypothetical protein